jgi:hypothetical protein
MVYTKLDLELLVAEGCQDPGLLIAIVVATYEQFRTGTLRWPDVPHQSPTFLRPAR